MIKKEKEPFIKLQWKMTAIILTILFIVLASYTVYAIHRQSEELEEELLNKAQVLAQAGAVTMERVFENAIETEQLTREEVWDRDYEPFGDSVEQMYGTSYDGFTDREIQDIIDQMQRDEEVEYAVLVDINGYLPTHNSNFSVGEWPQNRTKRIFDDEVGLKAARNTDPFLRQVYYRPGTDEIMWDVSSPVYVEGDHWGAFRIGFSMDRIEEKLAAVRWRVITSMLLVMVVIALAIYTLSGFIAKPLVQLSSTVGRLAEGDFTVQVKSYGRDEVGKIADSLENMINNQRKSLQEVRDTSDGIASSSQQLSAAIEESNASMQEISRTVEEHVAKMAQNIALSSQEAAEKSIKTENVATEGGEAVKQAVDSMEEIKKNSDEVSNMVDELTEASKQISVIAKTITGIADQTNLLALNAAIEAARAGEHGKGFAVVAEEVRKLAEESSKAAGEIGELIDNIQRKTVNVASSTREAVKAVDDGTERAEVARDYLSKIIESINGLKNFVQEVSESAETQSASVEEIVASINEQKTVLDEISNATVELSHMADGLNSLLERYRFKGGEDDSSDGGTEDYFYREADITYYEENEKDYNDEEEIKSAEEYEKEEKEEEDEDKF
ncbi:MAG: methyl-accepting chemotaxis protein [Candidatus Syntrophonatronum acetioxidans]|uniref:Methyl-accepting chemotaxis protein n=1 Tax=Candidatus Syntrophonatronum acetioxidans TaxID=1795816 RepID=A0A424YH08_9FIRM|nr:MAG: methyl-accepting chemotaxis protein [Candidatus Syntrophonatronum acetioxidans]